MATGSSSAALKCEIERNLASRIPAALSPLPVQVPRFLGVGIPSVEALLGGGLPIGSITEFTGPMSSGRTSFALSVLAGASADAACAYIDANDTFDPTSAAAAGVRLRSLLWVRFAVASVADSILVNRLACSVARAVPESSPSHQHRGHSHPRTETKGLDRTLETMLHHKAEARLNKAEGTPGFPNQRLSLVSASQDQVAYDHFNARRADDSDPLRQLDLKAADKARDCARHSLSLQTSIRTTESPADRLQKVISATDRVLQAGGFRVVVLDLASTPVEQAFRIPTATWFRFRRAAQEGDAALLLLTQQPCARSSAACVLECNPHSSGENAGNVFEGLSHMVQVARQRTGDLHAKKMPGRVTNWGAATPWMRGAGK
jgi:recombination protein RecA